eukprot:TRINITY_DN7913_c0_g1_i3.p1 TRINITY_DN7913_c0_g1~~TRINITY_DN7913_c0_g1_i3.p1  ORF type:complete len:747 (-),score=207.63 TRINITY_DN7913_c0_g1_i3:21-2261(-)
MATLLTSDTHKPGALFMTVLEYCDTSDPRRKALLGMQAQVLLDRGVDPSYAQDGKTVFDVANDCVNIDILTLMVEQQPELLIDSHEKPSPVLAMFDTEMSKPSCSPDRVHFITQVAALLCQRPENNARMLGTVMSQSGKDPVWGEVCIGMIKESNLQDQLVDPEAGYKTIHLAAGAGSTQVTAWLLDNGVELECRTACGETPLHIATQFGMPDVVTMLLKRGADPAAAANRVLPGTTPIHEAVISSASTILSQLIQVAPEGSTRQTAYWGRTPLHLLSLTRTTGSSRAHQRLLECCTQLLDSGTPVDAQDVDGETALSYIVRSKESAALPLAKILLDRGADPARCNVHRESALQLVFHSGNLEMISLFRKHDPRVFESESTCTAALAEDKLGMIGDMQPVVGQMCSVLGQSSAGFRVPLGWTAVYGGQHTLARELLGGSDLGIADVDQSSLLHKLCYWSRSEKMWSAVCGQAGSFAVAANSADVRGQTPLQVALAVHNEAAIRALIKGGAEATEQLVSAALEQQLPGVRVLFALGLGDFLASTREIVLPEPPSSTMADALAWCSSTGLKYVDMCFPPSLSSLAQCKLHSQHRDVEWVRLSELGLSSMEWGATLQCGALGDPFFLSAMPVCSAGMIETHPESAACGVYTVNLQWQGQEHSVVVDDFIPVLDGKSALCESADHSAGAQLYIKACAKLAGSFEALSMCRRADHFDQTVFELTQTEFCLLYTSDAADEEDSVDLGGRRNI